MSDPNFGQRMKALRAANPGVYGAGRKPIAEKYKPQMAAMERVFARSLPKLAQTYVNEIYPQQPEKCPSHQRTLVCPEDTCAYQSQRREFNHKAATYAIDRIAGRPTTRSENSVTLTTVEQLTIAFLAVFEEVNELDEPTARRLAFAERCEQLSSVWAGPGA